MDIKVKNKELYLKYKLKKGEFYRVSEDKNYKVISIYRKPKSVNGITSYCSDGKHVLFADYDNCMKWIVLKDYERMQKSYGLPPAYLFTTKEKEEAGQKFGNYHVISLIKLNPNDIFNILSETHCDINYTSMPQRNVFKNWVLRISNKGKRNRPRFLEIIGESICLDNEISTAHLDFLNKIYKLPEIKYTKQDGGKSIFLQKYDTMNY